MRTFDTSQSRSGPCLSWTREEVHAYLGQRVIAREEVEALSRAVISEPLVCDSRAPS